MFGGHGRLRSSGRKGRKRMGGCGDALTGAGAFREKRKKVADVSNDLDGLRSSSRLHVENCSKVMPRGAVERAAIADRAQTDF